MSFETWLANRPAVIQAAARTWPVGTVIHTLDQRFYVIGWAESTDDDAVSLILSLINPHEDPSGAIDGPHHYVHADCVRLGPAKVHHA